MTDGFTVFLLILMLASGWLSFRSGVQIGRQKGFVECCESRGGEYLAGKCVRKGSELR